MLTIEDLERGDCRWPVADASAGGRRGAILYCGAPIERGRLVGRLPCPYCREHAALAYRLTVQRPVARLVERREIIAAPAVAPAIARELTGELSF
ncbi:hypothetical protein [Methylocapsa acidiphila]|uniref:hypothetical protein n=1 Tax=Methylocapsa acidiphila TaxID=133552 RepID=UPI00041CE1C5|nr:hypothetical protein [Methylocapsa acidiphila]